MERNDTQGTLDMSPEAIKARRDAFYAASNARAREEVARLRRMTSEEPVWIDSTDEEADSDTLINCFIHHRSHDKGPSRVSF